LLENCGLLFSHFFQVHMFFILQFLLAGYLNYIDMRFQEFMFENIQNRIIYLDMDGVLADFRGGYQKLFGSIPNMNAKDDANVSRLVGTDFFAHLDKLPDADRIVDLAIKYAGSYSICSSPLRGDHKNSAQNKIKWIQENLNPQPNDIVITGKKDSYAKGKNILIDDRQKVLQPWIERGGIGIWYNAYIHDVSKVEKELAEIFKDSRG